MKIRHIISEGDFDDWFDDSDIKAKAEKERANKTSAEDNERFEEIWQAWEYTTPISNTAPSTPQKATTSQFSYHNKNAPASAAQNTSATAQPTQTANTSELPISRFSKTLDDSASIKKDGKIFTRDREGNWKDINGTPVTTRGEFDVLQHIATDKNNRLTAAEVRSAIPTAAERRAGIGADDNDQEEWDPLKKAFKKFFKENVTSSKEAFTDHLKSFVKNHIFADFRQAGFDDTSKQQIQSALKTLIDSYNKPESELKKDFKHFVQTMFDLQRQNPEYDSEELTAQRQETRKSLRNTINNLSQSFSSPERRAPKFSRPNRSGRSGLAMQMAKDHLLRGTTFGSLFSTFKDEMDVWKSRHKPSEYSKKISDDEKNRMAVQLRHRITPPLGPVVDDLFKSASEHPGQEHVFVEAALKGFFKESLSKALKEDPGYVKKIFNVLIGMLKDKRKDAFKEEFIEFAEDLFEIEWESNPNKEKVAFQQRQDRNDAYQAALDQSIADSEKRDREEREREMYDREVKRGYDIEQHNSEVSSAQAGLRNYSGNPREQQYYRDKLAGLNAKRFEESSSPAEFRRLRNIMESLDTLSEEQLDELNWTKTAAGLAAAGALGYGMMGGGSKDTAPIDNDIPPPLTAQQQQDEKEAIERFEHAKKVIDNYETPGKNEDFSEYFGSQRAILVAALDAITDNPNGIPGTDFSKEFLDELKNDIKRDVRAYDQMFKTGRTLGGSKVSQDGFKQGFQDGQTRLNQNAPSLKDLLEMAEFITRGGC